MRFEHKLFSFFSFFPLAFSILCLQQSSKRAISSQLNSYCCSLFFAEFCFGWLSPAYHMSTQSLSLVSVLCITHVFMAAILLVYGMCSMNRKTVYFHLIPFQLVAGVIILPVCCLISFLNWLDGFHVNVILGKCWLWILTLKRYEGTSSTCTHWICCQLLNHKIHIVEQPFYILIYWT